jgi:hypothetical protein
MHRKISINTFTYLVYIYLVILITACKKEEPQPEIVVKAKSDFGVSYSTYKIGELYTSDTFQTKFNINNYGPETFNVGDTLWASVEINKVIYGLSLIGKGPTAIVLKNPLPVNGTYEYNPGYLLRSSTLNYLGKDTTDVVILMYGQNKNPIDQKFSDDPTPENNTATLRLTKKNHYVVK